MKPGNFEYLKKEVVPSEHVHVYLGMESFMSTYFEMNFSEPHLENIQLLYPDEMQFNIWFSWN